MFKHKNNSDIFKFSILQFFYYITLCAFNSFIVFYLSNKGYSNTNIGFVMLSYTVLGIIGQYFWGYMCDVKKTFKKVFIFCMIITISLVILFSLINQNIYIIILVYGIIGFMQSGIPSIIDTWILQSSNEISQNYGFTRSFGSLGFSIFAIILGKLINLYGWSMMYLSFTFFSVSALICSLFIKDTFNNHKEQSCCNTSSSNTTPNKINPLILFKNFNYVFFITISILLFLPQQIFNIYLPIIIKNVNGNPSHLGAALFISAMSEVPILTCFKFIMKKVKPQILIIVSALMYCIRMIVLMHCSEPSTIIIASLFQGLTFGLYLPASKYYIQYLAPENLKTTAQAMGVSFTMGISGVIASYLGGVLLDKFGVAFLLQLSSIFAGLSFLIFTAQELLIKFNNSKLNLH